MGNSKAYPVLRTTDAATAYAQAKRLVGLLEQIADEVWLMAELHTVADVRRMARALPQGPYDYLNARKDPTTGEYLSFDADVTTADDATLEAALPLDLSEEFPRGELEDLFVAALGTGTASIDWHGRWPEDDEADCHGTPRYDGVQVVFHGNHAQWDTWTEHHTVFVHTDKWGDLPRARKLAAYIGSEVVGEQEVGW